MVEPDKYMNNKERDERVMPPGHITLQNTSHMHMTYTRINEYNSKVVQDTRTAGKPNKYNNIHNKPI